MIITVNSSVLSGYMGLPIKIELDISRGFPSVLFVGLADTIIKESKERIRVALENNGYMMPHKKVTVNFVPADIKKMGSHLDLPIALALAGAISVADNENFDTKDIGVFGELSLNGDLIALKEIIPLLVSLQERGIKKFIIPKKNVKEAKLLKRIQVIGIKNIMEAIFCYYCENKKILSFASRTNPEFSKDISEFKWIDCNGSYKVDKKILDDFEQVLGQNIARRACEIAVAGMHNLMMMGSPGCGKSMLAKRLPSIMPKLSYDEVIELTKIYSISNVRIRNGIVTQRPFRSPHSGISAVSMCGGGNPIRPGEISLSHRGVLFLDEFLEYKRQVLESLRQPIEDSKITITRANESIEFPSKFLLVCAFNPCPCGFLNDETKECKCTPYEIKRYSSKLSGPIVDRFDIQVYLKKVEYDALRSSNKAESSKEILSRILEAREFQKNRFHSELKLNSDMSIDEIKEYCKLSQKTERILEDAYANMHLSARSLNSILKVSRTIADLEKKSEVESKHVLEAIQYRRIDLMMDKYF